MENSQQMLTCKTCDKEYSRSGFGSGRRYCSPLCRFKATMPLYSTSGRPRRFPRDRGMLQLVPDHLRLHGWQIRPYPNNDYRLFIQRGWFKARITVGGDYRDEEWADACIYTEDNLVHIVSTCRKLPSPIARIDPRSNKRVTIKRNVPCKQHGCKSCTTTAWITTLHKLDNEKSSKPLRTRNTPPA